MPVRKFRCLRKYAKPWKKRLAAHLRRNMTFPERLLWSRLKNKQLGVCIHPQKIVLGWIFDYWIPSSGLCVEIDGRCHDTRKAYDRKRDLILKGRGIRTLRFKASEVMKNLNAVVAIIQAEIKKRMR